MDVGARTPLGLDATTSAAAVRAGIVRIEAHETLVDSTGEPLRAAVDGRLDDTLMGWERMAALLSAPLQHTLRSVPPHRPDAPLALMLALPEHRPGFGAAEEQRLHQYLGSIAPAQHPFGIHTVGHGHAAGLLGLHRAVELIGERHFEVALVLGVDSYLDADTLRWLGEGRRIKTRETRSSFFPGEAAGCVAVVSDTALRTLRLPSLATIQGTGVAREPSASEDPATDPVNLGRGLSAAIEKAAASLLGNGQSTDRVLCDLNGERMRSEEWGMVALRSHRALTQAGDFEAPAGQWGDIGAASGPLLVALAVAGWQRGYHRGSTTLLFAGSDAGLRAAVVLERPS
ncbi:MAG: hypothetical protein AAF799_17415 [Myxococcota bacterium]